MENEVGAGLRLREYCIELSEDFRCWNESILEIAHRMLVLQDYERQLGVKVIESGIRECGDELDRIVDGAIRALQFEAKKRKKNAEKS